MFSKIKKRRLKLQPPILRRSILRNSKGLFRVILQRYANDLPFFSWGEYQKERMTMKLTDY